MAFVATLEIVLMMALVAGFDVGGFAVRSFFWWHRMRRVAHRAFPDFVHVAFVGVWNVDVGIHGGGIGFRLNVFGAQAFKGAVAAEALFFGHLGGFGGEHQDGSRKGSKKKGFHGVSELKKGGAEGKTDFRLRPAEVRRDEVMG